VDGEGNLIATIKENAELVEGKATIDVTGLGVGDHSFIAEYSGSTVYAESSASLPDYTVIQADPSLTLEALPADGTGEAGAIVTLTAKVAASGTCELPTGTVTFLQDGKPIAENVALNKGMASIEVKDLVVETLYDFTAQYSGDTNYTVDDAEIEDYNLVKSAQAAVSIENPGVVEYGDVIQLEGVGGSVGDWVFFAATNPYIDVTPEGLLTAKAATPAGASVTVSAYREAEGNYKQSDEATLALVVLRRTIPIPEANTPLTYNGALQIAVPEGTGYTVVSGSAIEPGTYMAFVTPDANYRWPGGSIAQIAIAYEILSASVTPVTPVTPGKKGEQQGSQRKGLVLVVETLPAEHPDSIAFAPLRPEGAVPTRMYEAKLVNLANNKAFELAQQQVYLIEIIHPITGEEHRVLLQEHPDGTFDCVLVEPGKVIRYPVKDFSLYGAEADEVYIEGIEPHVDVDLDGWAYWVWHLDGAEDLILRIENRQED
jgi:hypothetical protein